MFCDGHRALLGQNQYAPLRTSAAPHEGHFFGNFHGFALGGRLERTGPTTSGMTSPARRTMTVSPSRTSFRLTSSMLCRVTLLTVTPPTNTGSSLATGV